MNLLKRLKHLAEKLDSNRAYGKTTMLVKAAKELDAVFIVASNNEVTYLQRKFQVAAKNMDTNMDGMAGPFLIDNHAVSRMFERAADKIEDLEKQNEALKKQLVDLGHTPRKPPSIDELSAPNLNMNQKTKTGFDFSDY